MKWVKNKINNMWTTKTNDLKAIIMRYPNDKLYHWSIFKNDEQLETGNYDGKITSLKNQIEETFFKCPAETLFTCKCAKCGAVIKEDVEEEDEKNLCPDCDDEDCDTEETIVKKTYRRKEKKVRKDGIDQRELGCALWFIGKMDSLDRAEKVFSAAMAAQRSIEPKKDVNETFSCFFC